MWPAVAAVQKPDRSYWWLAWSLLPTIAAALGVVPQPGDGVAVVVVHGQRRIAAGAGRPDRLDELVEQAAVVGLLHRDVAVVVVAGDLLAAIQPLRVGQIGVAGQQHAGEPVDRGRVGLGVEGRLTRRVGGVRVAAEVVVEGVILLVDDD